MQSEALTPTQLAYREYLKSDHWRGLRLEAFQTYGRKCAKCPATCRLDVHHLKYRHPWTLGIVQDLQILCRACHEREHGVVRVVPVELKKQAQKKNPLEKLLSLRAKVKSGLPLLPKQRQVVHVKLMRGNQEERKLANEIFQTNSAIPMAVMKKWKSLPPGVAKALKRQQKFKGKKFLKIRAKYAKAFRVKY